jgi:hypothetical protein
VSEDPRLLEWIDLTKRVFLSGEDERGESLRQLAERRAELQLSLELDPPGRPPGPELTRTLLEAEKALNRITEALKADLRRQIVELRQLQGAARGYRPTEENIPAFVSKSI